jgi:hypothetical protein
VQQSLPCQGRLGYRRDQISASAPGVLCFCRSAQSRRRISRPRSISSADIAGHDQPEASPPSLTYETDSKGAAMILALISVLTIVVVGAICFWAIDKFATDRRLANLLKLLVILICLGAILQRILPLTGIY